MTNAPNTFNMTLNLNNCYNYPVYTKLLPTKPKRYVHFALRLSVFDIQGLQKSQMHHMISEWPWTFNGQELPIFFFNPFWNHYIFSFVLFFVSISFSIRIPFRAFFFNSRLLGYIKTTVTDWRNSNTNTNPFQSSKHGSQQKYIKRPIGLNTLLDSSRYTWQHYTNV